jgi:hypothetical protein
MVKKKQPKQVLEKMLRNTSAKLQKTCPDVQPIITYGTLLGHMREGAGQCLDNDNDVDFWIHHKDWNSFDSCAHKLYGNQMYKNDQFITVDDDGVQVDFYKLGPHSSGSLCDKWNFFKVSEQDVLPLTPHGNYFLPAHSIHILESHYGDWTIPNKEGDGRTAPRQC